MAFPGFRRAADVSILKVIVFAVLGLVFLATGTFAFLVWSTWKIDTVSTARQTELASHVIGRFRYQIAHDQESVTVWDDAVENVQKHEADGALDWIDLNLGSWMSSYFGHDAAYIVDAEDKAIYASLLGERRDSAAYDAIAPVIAPMLKQLRSELKSGETAGTETGVSTRGETDFRFVNGRPAVVSLKPIVSDSGEIAQVPGREYVHIAVRYLDGRFLQELESKYDFDNMPFSLSSGSEMWQVGLPLTTKCGEIVGYVVWEPYRPGLAFLQSITPVLVVVLFTLVVVVAIFIGMLYRRAMANREQENRIRYLASHDSLTGLLNRASFEARLDAVLADAGDKPRQVAILYLDLDRFKPINDTLGHAAGDAMLVHASKVLSRQVPRGDLVARIGGDEFVILARRAVAPAELSELCERIIVEMNKPIDFEGFSCRCGVSIGIAQASGISPDARRILVNADIALYQAKETGRNCYEFFTPDLQANIVSKKRMADELLTGLERDEFTVWYQPQFETASMQLCGAEALVRWNHPDRGVLASGHFLKVAEELNVMARIDQIVLERALRDQMRWTALGVTVPRISVNVSSKRLHDATLVEQLHGLSISPGTICFELVESIFLDESDDVVTENIERIKRLGIDIEIDDFGTGHTSILSLLRLKPKRLKIDRQLVMPITNSPQERALVRSIIEIARSLGVETVAEGVESLDHAGLLRQLGCDFLQGYAFAKPLPFEEFTRFTRGYPQRKAS